MHTCKKLNDTEEAKLIPKKTKTQILYHLLYKMIQNMEYLHTYNTRSNVKRRLYDTKEKQNNHPIESPQPPTQTLCTWTSGGLLCLGLYSLYSILFLNHIFLIFYFYTILSVFLMMYLLY